MKLLNLTAILTFYLVKSNQLNITLVVDDNLDKQFNMSIQINDKLSFIKKLFQAELLLWTDMDVEYKIIHSNPSTLAAATAAAEASLASVSFDVNSSNNATVVDVLVLLYEECEQVMQFYNVIPPNNQNIIHIAIITTATAAGATGRRSQDEFCLSKLKFKGVIVILPTIHHDKSLNQLKQMIKMSDWKETILLTNDDDEDGRKLSIGLDIHPLIYISNSYMSNIKQLFHHNILCTSHCEQIISKVNIIHTACIDTFHL